MELQGHRTLDSFKVQELKAKLDELNQRITTGEQRVFDGSEESPITVEEQLRRYGQLVKLLKALRAMEYRDAQQRLVNHIQKIKDWLKNLRTDGGLLIQLEDH